MWWRTVIRPAARTTRKRLVGRVPFSALLERSRCRRCSTRPSSGEMGPTSCALGRMTRSCQRRYVQTPLHRHVIGTSSNKTTKTSKTSQGGDLDGIVDFRVQNIPISCSGGFVSNVWDLRVKYIFNPFHFFAFNSNNFKSEQIQNWTFQIWNIFLKLEKIKNWFFLNLEQFLKIRTFLKCDFFSSLNIFLIWTNFKFEQFSNMNIS